MFSGRPRFLWLLILLFGLAVSLTSPLSPPGGRAFATTTHFANMTVDSTSEADSTGNNLLIGEVVRMRLEVGVPVGTYANYEVRQALPFGMQYIDGTARYAFVDTAGGLSSTNQIEAGCTSALLSVNPTCTFTPGTASGFGSGGDVTMSFDTLANTEGDADSEYIVVELDVLVLNTSINQHNTTLQLFGIVASGSTLASTPNLFLTVLEPQFSITSFTQNISSGDAGDFIVFDIRFDNTSGAPAYNVRFDHLFPPGIQIDTLLGGSGVSPNTFTSNPAGVLAEYNVINPGQFASLRYRYRVSNTASPGLAITNTATVTYTSLPGARGTGDATPGTSGSGTGERNGSDGVGGALNNFADSESLIFNMNRIAVTIDIESSNDPNTGTSQGNPAFHDMAIGETFVYLVTVTVPEGTSYADFRLLTVVGTLAGTNETVDLLSIEIVSVGSSLSGGAISSTPNSAPISPGRTNTTSTNIVMVNPTGDGGFTFSQIDFGTVLNTPDGVSNANDRITYRVYARMDSNPLNVNAADAAKRIQYSWRGLDGVEITDNVITYVEAVEPRIDVDLTASPTTAAEGETVTFTLTLANNGIAPAYDVDVTHALPSSGPTNYMTFGSINAGASTCDDRTGYSATTGTPNTTFGFDNLLLGESCTLVITAALNSNAVSGTTYTATATVNDYQSQPGAVTDLRTFGPHSDTATVTRSTPTVTFNSVTIDEATASGTLTVSFDVAHSSDITIPYTVAAGTPAATGGGTDYTLADGSVTIPAGSLSNTIPFTINNDALDESDERFIVTLGATAGVSIPTPAATVTITDNDPVPTVSASDVTVSEAAGSGNITVSLGSISGRDVIVPYTIIAGIPAATGGGTDYTLADGNLTIPAGSPSGNIAFTLNNDTVDEPNELFQVLMGAPINGTLITATVNVTITDDDNAPTITFNDVVIAENAVSGNLTVTLSNASVSDVTVPYTVTAGSPAATGGGVDYTLADGTLIITAGNLSGDIPFTLNDDTLDELDEVFEVTLGVVVNATAPDPLATVTITDDEATPTITFNDVVVAEDAATGVLTVTLSAVSALDVTIPYTVAAGTPAATGGGTDYTLADGTLIITAGNLSGDIPFTLNDDALDEANEVFEVTLGAVVNASAPDPLATVTITDNDGDPSLSVTDVNVSEAAGTGSVTVTLSPASGQDVSFNFVVTDVSASNGADYAVTTASPVTIPAGTTAITLDFTVTNDATVEGDETFTIELTGLTNAIGGLTTATVTILDNDTAGVTALPSGADTLVEETVAPPPAGQDDFTVQLNTDPSATVTMTLSVTDGQTRIRVPGGTFDTTLTLTWLATGGIPASPTESVWNTPLTVEVEAVDDTLAENSPHPGEIVITTTGAAEYNSLAPLRFPVSINDNEPGLVITTTNGGNSVNEVPTPGAADIDTFDLSLRLSPTGPVTLTLTVPSTLVIGRPGGPFSNTLTITFYPTAGTPTAPDTLWNVPQTVEIRAVADNVLTGGTASITVTTVAGSAPEYLALTFAPIAVRIVEDETTPNDEIADGGESGATATPTFPNSDYIIKTADRTVAQIGDTVIYTIRLGNPTATPITTGRLTDVFDSRLSAVQVLSASVGVAAVSGNTVTVEGVVLQPGQTATIRIAARISERARPGDVISNVAEFSYNPTFASNDAPITIITLPSTLPNTGETPLWRQVAPALLAALFILLVAIGGVYLRRRQAT